MTGAEFHEANNKFKYMSGKLREEDKGQIRHKKAFEKGDVQKLYSHVMLIYRQGTIKLKKYETLRFRSGNG